MRSTTQNHTKQTQIKIILFFLWNATAIMTFQSPKKKKNRCNFPILLGIFINRVRGKHKQIMVVIPILHNECCKDSAQEYLSISEFKTKRKWEMFDASLTHINALHVSLSLCIWVGSLVVATTSRPGVVEIIILCLPFGISWESGILEQRLLQAFIW